MKPTLKAPGSERLKLEHEKLLSNFAFTFDLRRYNMAQLSTAGGLHSSTCRLNLSRFYH
jgi:hypothetical protein